jgi:hypothetical protein
MQVQTRERRLMPGSYAQVRLTSGSLGQIVTLPNNTLLFRAQVLQVGVVKPDNGVELRDIKVGRDYVVEKFHLPGGFFVAEYVASRNS